jgi:hypothetical protein
MDKIWDPLLNKIVELLLKKIEENNAQDVFFYFGLFIIIIVTIVVIIISFISWRISTKKINIEIKKINAEQISVSMKNYDDLLKHRKRYLDSSILVQMGTSDITQVIKQRDEHKLTDTIKTYRDLIFNEMIEYYEQYCIAFEIQYQKDSERFSQLMKDEFFPMLDVIDEILLVINSDFILEKSRLKKIILKKNIYNGITNIFKRNIDKYSVINRIRLTLRIKESFKKKSCLKNTISLENI